jgi:site-specific DNA recombinase
MVSGIERLNIKRRTYGGKLEWAKKGRVIASPFRPYGYRFVKMFDGRGRKASCNLEIVPEEAEAVRLMYEWCAYECLTIYAIAKRLTEMGVPTMSMKERTTRRNPEGLWHRNTVYRILASRTYAGEWQYGKHEFKREDTADGIKVKSRLRKDEERITVSVPAIVSKDLWQAVQKQLQANTAKFIKPTKYQYLLRGRITCATCNHHMCGHYWQPQRPDGYRYYMCHKLPNPAMSGEHCPARQIRADVIERATWEAVCDAWHDEKRLFEGVTKRREDTAAARCRIEQLISIEDEEISRAETECTRWNKAYGAGAINLEELVTHRNERDAKIARHQAEISNLKQRLAEASQIQPEFEAELHRIQVEIAGRLTPDTPYEGRKHLIEMLDVRVDWDSQTSQAHISGLVGDKLVHLTSVSA